MDTERYSEAERRTSVFMIQPEESPDYQQLFIAEPHLRMNCVDRRLGAYAMSPGELVTSCNHAGQKRLQVQHLQRGRRGPIDRSSLPPPPPDLAEERGVEPVHDEFGPERRSVRSNGSWGEILGESSGLPRTHSIPGGQEVVATLD
jgi:hypothetical protein